MRENFSRNVCIIYLLGISKYEKSLLEKQEFQGKLEHEKKYLHTLDPLYSILHYTPIVIILLNELHIKFFVMIILFIK